MKITLLSRRARIAFFAVTCSSLVAAIAAPWPSGDFASRTWSILVRTQTTRKSTDPPIAGQGNLGQDLFLAIDHRDLAGVQSLINQGADPNARNGLEFTPLYIAAASHQVNVMKALIKAGAKPDAASVYGTALTFAASSGNIEGARYLISLGANVNAGRADGLTVIMMAADGGSPEVVRELLEHQANVNALTDTEGTALMYAARRGNVPVGQLLLEAGALVDKADVKGQTPLMVAAAAGHTNFARLLLSKGADPNHHDEKGRTALILAAGSGDYPDLVNTLLHYGAKANTADSEGRTAPALVARREFKKSAALLGKATPKALAALPRRSAKEAIPLGLKTLQTSMKAFSEMTGCVSCHHEGLGRMTTGSARTSGFKIDNELQLAQAQRIRGMVNAMQPLHSHALKDPEVMKQVPLIEINEISVSDAWFLAGMAFQMEPANEATAAMAMVLARQQAPSGQWSFSGPRVPMQSSFFTTTALAIRSLVSYGPRANTAEISGRIRKAKAWLLSTRDESSEDRSSRLLGLKWAGANQKEMRAAVGEIRADQRPDGGWSQLSVMQSDAYATGQALFALRVSGLPVTDPAYVRGVQFLLRTQEKDGSWFVNKRATPSNNYFDADFPYGESQYASFNGTCWAILALLETAAPGKTSK